METGEQVGALLEAGEQVGEAKKVSDRSMADLVRLEKVGPIYVLTLLGDGEHRLNDPLFKAIREAMETVHNSEDALALVTTNEGKFFCNGLDMDWVRWRRAQGEKGEVFRNSFNHLLATVVNMNVPTIAAICGHASAGGFIFALAHDHRCMRGDRGYLYMSEMDVQLRIATTTMRIIETALSPKAFKDTMLLARKQTAKEAHDAGIVDSVHENSAKTLEAAIAWATQLSSRGWERSFYRNMRLDMNPGLLDGLIADIDEPPSWPQHPTLSKL